MSASKSAYLRAAIYNAIYKATAFTGPATMYMSLHTADPGLTGANEITGNAYARTAIAMTTPTAGAGSNSSSPTFPAPTPAAWGTATHFAIWDAATVGNCLIHDALTNPIATSIGVAVNFPIGNVTGAET